MSTALEPGEAALLRRVAMVLLPGGDGVPGAGDVDLVMAPIPPGLAAAVQRALAALATRPDELPEAVADLAGTDPAAHDALLLVIAAAYYADPAVRVAIGYPGPLAAPLPTPPDADDASLAPLLERVRRRGPAYRDTSPR